MQLAVCTWPCFAFEIINSILFLSATRSKRRVIVHWSYVSAHRRHEIPLLRQTGMAKRCVAFQRFVKHGKHPECVTRVTHEVQSQSSSRPVLEKQHEWIFFVQQRKETKTNDELLLFCCITVMQISLCRPRSMSGPGEKNTFPLIPPPTFDLIISALLLKNRPEHRAGG